MNKEVKSKLREPSKVEFQEGLKTGHEGGLVTTIHAKNPVGVEKRVLNILKEESKGEGRGE